MARAKATRPLRESLGQEHKYQVTKYCDNNRPIFANRTDAQVAEHLSKHFGFQIKASHVNGIRGVLGIKKHGGTAGSGTTANPADVDRLADAVGVLFEHADLTLPSETVALIKRARVNLGLG